MKTKLLIAALIAGVAATSVSAAGFGRGEAGSFGGRMGAADLDFATIDANGDGSITLEEMQAIPATKFAAVDTDGSGTLTQEELTAQITADIELRAANHAQMQIAQRDTDGDGVLSLEEMQPTDTTRLATGFARLDADADGVVTAEEFEAFQTAKAERMDRHGERGGRDGGPRSFR